MVFLLKDGDATKVINVDEEINRLRSELESGLSHLLECVKAANAAKAADPEESTKHAPGVKAQEPQSESTLRHTRMGRNVLLGCADLRRKHREDGTTYFNANLSLELDIPAIIVNVMGSTGYEWGGFLRDMLLSVLSNSSSLESDGVKYYLSIHSSTLKLLRLLPTIANKMREYGLAHPMDLEFGSIMLGAPDEVRRSLGKLICGSVLSTFINPKSYAWEILDAASISVSNYPNLGMNIDLCDYARSFISAAAAEYSTTKELESDVMAAVGVINLYVSEQKKGPEPDRVPSSGPDDEFERALRNVLSSPVGAEISKILGDARIACRPDFSRPSLRFRGTGTDGYKCTCGGKCRSGDDHQ